MQLVVPAKAPGRSDLGDISRNRQHLLHLENAEIASNPRFVLANKMAICR
jgi:hypothetical protein